MMTQMEGRGMQVNRLFLPVQFLTVTISANTSLINTSPFFIMSSFFNMHCTVLKAVQHSDLSVLDQ